MKGLLDAVYATGVVVALWGTALELGVRRSARDLVTPLGNAGLIARVALLDVVVLPLLVWSLVHVAPMPDGYATGLVLVGIASGGPLGVRAAMIARGDAETALSLVVVLELVNLAAVPVWASVLLPAGTSFDERGVVAALVLLVALPLALGLAWRRFGVAGREDAWLSLVANVALAVAVAAVVVRDGDLVWQALGAYVPLVSVATVAAALALGWAVGGPAHGTRRSVSLVTGVRANAVALAIATTSFRDVPEVRAGVLVFALFSITLPLAVAAAWGRRHAAATQAA